MTRASHALAGALAAALAVACAACGSGRPSGSASSSGSAPGGEQGTEGAAAPSADGTASSLTESLREIMVLFPSASDEQLHAEKRTILWTASVEDRARQILSELVVGPQGGPQGGSETEGGAKDRLLPAMPSGVKLREFFLLGDGTGFADLSREILAVRGAAGERIALQAIVLTLRVNCPEIRRVMVLVDGQDVESLAGHIDLRYPLEPDLSLLAPGLAPGQNESVGDATQDNAKEGDAGGTNAARPSVQSAAAPARAVAE